MFQIVKGLKQARGAVLFEVRNGGTLMTDTRTGRLLAGVALSIGLLAGAAHANESAMKAASDPNGWGMYSKGYDGTRFSPLKEINADNVKNLKLAYSFSLASLRSNESSPLVIGDTLYVSSSWGPKYVYALDAATGAVLENKAEGPNPD